ncbi:MAG: hypothetical protein WA728_27175, partial [Xanthobacteraceae bacterium]
EPSSLPTGATERETSRDICPTRRSMDRDVCHALRLSRGLLTKDEADRGEYRQAVAVIAAGRFSPPEHPLP